MESNSKIIELDDDEISNFSDESENEESVQFKFKQDVLKNRSIFERQLLETGGTSFNPEEVFEIRHHGQNERDDKELMTKMDLDVLELEVECDDVNREDVETHESNKVALIAKKMNQLEGHSGIYKKLCRSGEGRTPPENSIVTIHYNGYVQDEVSGEVLSFDSSVARGKPKTFLRGQGDVILGLDFAVGSMKKKEQAEFAFEPQMAFGITGCPPRIPPNAWVYFKVDLLEWVDSAAAEAFSKMPHSKRKELPFQQVMEAAKSEKRKGNAQFEKNNFVAAEKCYRHALGWIQEHGYANEEEENLGQALCLDLNLNLATTYLQLSKPKKTCIHCKEALLIDPQNPKAFYRLGKAQNALGDYAAAQSYLLRAQLLAPNDPSITRSLLELNKKVEREKYVEKDLCARMLGTMSMHPPKDLSGISEEAAKLYKEQLENFCASDSTLLVFAPGKTPEERRFLEFEAKKLGLIFGVKPTLDGESICEIRK